VRYTLSLHDALPISLIGHKIGSDGLEKNKKADIDDIANFAKSQKA
jgi:hypothetical protein